MAARRCRLRICAARGVAVSAAATAERGRPRRARTRRHAAVLRAANDAGARRVVLTSSFAAIGYSPKPSGLPYDETDWTDPTGDVTPYVKSKTLAERSAWDCRW